MFRSRFAQRRLAAVAASAAVILGGALAVAPTASAADSSSCNSGRFDLPNTHINTSGVNLRSGPGTNYSSRGQLSKGTRVFFYCYKSSPGAWAWDYVKVTSGPNKNIKGWVRLTYHDWD